MPKVLVIDDDLGTRETFAAALSAAGYQVCCADSARNGVRLAKQVQPNVAVVDMRLPDGDGNRVLRAVRQFSPATAVVMITGFGTTRMAVEAMQLGAANFLEKPVDIDELIAVVGKLCVVVEPMAHDASEATRHALDRWLDLVSRTIDLPSDPHTVVLWARGMGVSAGAIRGWCRAAHLPVKGSLNLARMIRVLARFDGRTPVGDLLNIVDTRTLVRFLRFGSPRAPSRLPISIDEFLERQRWIPDPAAIRRLRRVLPARLGQLSQAEPSFEDMGSPARDAEHQ